MIKEKLFVTGYSALKQLFIIFFLLGFHIIVFVQCNVGGSFVFNENFDDEKSIVRWKISDLNKSKHFSFIYGEGINGSNCYTIFNNEAGDLSISMTVDDLVPGIIYRVAAMVKTCSVEEGKGVLLTIENREHKRRVSQTACLLGSNDWEELSVDFQVSDSTNIMLCCRLGIPEEPSKGKVWFDSIRLEKVMSESPKANDSIKNKSENK